MNDKFKVIISGLVDNIIIECNDFSSKNIVICRRCFNNAGVDSDGNIICCKEIVSSECYDI